MIKSNRQRRYLAGFIISFLVFILSLWLLVTASPLLLASLLNKPYIPFGTFMTWLGLLSLPSMIFFWRKFSNKTSTRISRLTKIMLSVTFIVELGWPFVSYGLAGNWSFSFSSESAGFAGSEKAYQFFIYYTAIAALLPLFLIITPGLISLFKKRS